jgi:hypothetical protein
MRIYGNQLGDSRINTHGRKISKRVRPPGPDSPVENADTAFERHWRRHLGTVHPHSPKVHARDLLPVAEVTLWG